MECLIFSASTRLSWGENYNSQRRIFQSYSLGDIQDNHGPISKRINENVRFIFTKTFHHFLPGIDFFHFIRDVEIFGGSLPQIDADSAKDRILLIVVDEVVIGIKGHNPCHKGRATWDRHHFLCLSQNVLKLWKTFSFCLKTSNRGYNDANSTFFYYNFLFRLFFFNFVFYFF